MFAAKFFVEKFGERIRWCRQRGKYFIYDGKRWACDLGGDKVLGLAEQLPRLLHSEAAKNGTSHDATLLGEAAKLCNSRRGLLSVLHLAQGFEGIAVDLADFDKDPLIFNAANGTVDLRTGERRDHRAEDMLSKTSPVAYDPDAGCPRWHRFLREVFPAESGDDGDVELIEFVRLAVGYTLTALASEQVLFLMYGRGENGKSKFLAVLGAILGEYGVAAPPSTFMARENRNGTSDIARLDGVRFVSTVEPESGKRLDESIVKTLTGNDTVSAAFKYQEYFDFKPVLKPWLACNEPPGIRGANHGIWRRIRMIPFKAKFTTKLDVFQELLPELEGILAWAVQGCLAWQSTGLPSPASVVAATKEYRSDMDTVGGFLRATTVEKKNAETPLQHLVKRYERWAEANNERPLSSKAMSSRLAERGYEKEHKMHGVVFFGFELTPEPELVPSPARDLAFIERKRLSSYNDSLCVPTYGGRPSHEPTPTELEGYP